MKLFVQAGVFDGISKQKRPTGRFKVSCFEITRQYLIIGASTGGIYIYNRDGWNFKFLLSSQYGPVTWLCASPDEALLAVATSGGVVSVYPLLHTATHPLLTSKEHRDHKITYLKWNSDSTEVFIGDVDGKVTMMNTQAIMGNVLMWDPRVMQAAKLLRDTVTRVVDLGKNNEIVQVDCNESQVLVSSRSYSYMCSTQHHIYQQIGQKRRNGHHGSCFSSLSHGRALCVRPAFRLWAVDSSGNVLSTLSFKSVVESASKKPVLLQEGGPFERTKPSTFTKLLPFTSEYLLSYDSNFLYLIDVSNVSLVSCSSVSPSVLDLRFIDDSVYILSSDGCVKHLKWMGVEECASLLCQKELFDECTELLLEYGAHIDLNVLSRLCERLLEHIGEEKMNAVKDMIAEVESSRESSDQITSDWVKSSGELSDRDLQPSTSSNKIIRGVEVQGSDNESQNLQEAKEQDINVVERCSETDFEANVNDKKIIAEAGKMETKLENKEILQKTEYHEDLNETNDASQYVDNSGNENIEGEKRGYIEDTDKDDLKGQVIDELAGKRTQFDCDASEQTEIDHIQEENEVSKDMEGREEAFPVSFLWSHHAGASFHSLAAAEYAYSAIQADYYSTDGLKFFATGVQETFNSGSGFLKETLSTLSKNPHPLQVKDEVSFPLIDARNRKTVKEENDGGVAEVEEEFDFSEIQYLVIEDDPSEFLDENKVEKLMLLTNLVLDYKEESEVDPVIFQGLYEKWKAYLDELDNNFKKPVLAISLKNAQIVRKGLKLNAVNRCLLTKAFLLFCKHGVPSPNVDDDTVLPQRETLLFPIHDIEMQRKDFLCAKFYRNFSPFMDDHLLLCDLENKGQENYQTWLAITDKEVQLESYSRENHPKILKLVFQSEIDLSTKLSVTRSLFNSCPMSAVQLCAEYYVKPWQTIFTVLAGVELETKDECRGRFYECVFYYLLSCLTLACDSGVDVHEMIIKIFYPQETLFVFILALLECSQRGIGIREPWTAPRCPCGMVLPRGLDQMHPFGSLLLYVIDKCVPPAKFQEFQDVMWRYGMFEVYLQLIKQHRDVTTETRRRCLLVLYQSGSLDADYFDLVEEGDIEFLASVFVKEKNMCVTCTRELPSLITSSWRSLMRFGLATVGGRETVKILERYAQKIRLEIRDFQILSLAIALEKTHPKQVSTLLSMTSPDSALKKTMLLERKHSQEHTLMLRMFPITERLKAPHSELMWGCRAQLSTWTCPCCSLPILSRALAQDGSVSLFRCGHAYHGICLEVTKKSYCLLCR